SVRLSLFSGKRKEWRNRATLFLFTPTASLKVGVVAFHAKGLHWNLVRCGGNYPRWIGEVEEFRHIDLRGITRGQAGQRKAGFEEFQERGVVGHRMRHVAFLRIR